MYIYNIQMLINELIYKNEVLVRQEPSGRYNSDPQRVGNTCGAVRVRRMGKTYKHNGRQRERCVRQPESHSEHQPVPLPRLLLRRRDRLVLPQRQILPV